MNEQLKAAQIAYEFGDPSLALYLVKTVLKENNEDGRAWELLGLIQFARKRFSVSISALERASLLIPLTPPGRVCLAYGYACLDKTELACDLFIGLIDDESMGLSLLLQIAVGLDGLNHPALAMEACREASRRDPHHPQPYYDLGFYAARCGYAPRFTESLARKALSLDPTNVSYRVGLSSLLIRQERTDEAYEIVQDFADREIQSICCRCCLERIAELFETKRDYRRVAVCRQQLLALEVQGGQHDCH